MELAALFEDAYLVILDTTVAYTSRCEHALAARGDIEFVSRAREALPEFARELLP